MQDALLNKTLLNELAGTGGSAEELRTGSATLKDRRCTSDQEDVDHPHRSFGGVVSGRGEVPSRTKNRP